MAFILFDAHNFYVSAELVWQPDLVGHPVVVIGSNDGCVISRSQQAKDIGIKMGEPAHFVREEFWRHNVKFFSANFALYGDMSSRMMSVISMLVPKLTVYSVDEGFARCDGMSVTQLDDLAIQVRSTVKQWTGLPIGAGIGPTPTLAKVASYLAKRVFKNDQYAIHSEADRINALLITPVAEVWGVGPAYASRLRLAGVSTASDLANLSPEFIRDNFPVGLRRTHLELNGQLAVDIADPDIPRQMINVGRSFGRRIVCFEDLAPAFAAFAMKASEKLHKQRSVCGGVRAYLFSSARSSERPRALTATFTMRTCDPRAIAGAAVNCAAQMFKVGGEYSKGGICLLDLDQPDSVAQASLFDTYDENGSRISSLVSQVNARFGRGSLSVGRTLGSRVWMPKADMVSDAYTTRVEQLKVVY